MARPRRKFDAWLIVKEALSTTHLGNSALAREDRAAGRVIGQVRTAVIRDESAPLTARQRQSAVEKCQTMVLR